MSTEASPLDKSTFAVERTHPTVITVRTGNIRPGWEKWFLLRSDAHHDNALTNHALERKHLDEAKARSAGILDIGDLACAMGGKYDKRSDTSQLRPELRNTGKPYLDALTSYNAAFYEPYAKNWVMLSPGNHEVSILDRHETNLTERLAERLRARDSPVQVGSYQGWVRFMFSWDTTKRTSIHLRYTHGYGGGGQVTRDLIQANRQMVYVANADIIVSGHTHDSWAVPIAREKLDPQGKPIMQTVEVLKLGTYKDEYSPGHGWAVGKGHNPKPLGAYWLRFYLDSGHIQFETTRAK